MLNKLSAVLVIGAFLFSASPVHAQESQPPSTPYGPDWVEYRSTETTYQSYLKRRSENGLMFGIKMENYFPENYISRIDGYTFEDMFSKTDLTLMTFDIGYKRNLSIGSVYLALVYGTTMQTLEDSRINDEKRTFDAKMFGAKFNYIMDALMDEPYVAPYVGASVVGFSLEESAKTQGQSADTAAKTSIGWTVGALLQLNWIESDMSREAWLSTGMENTYIDVFLTSYQNSAAADEVDTYSRFNWGVGLTIEF